MKLKPKVTLLTVPGKVELWTRGERFAVYLPDDAPPLPICAIIPIKEPSNDEPLASD